MRIAHSWTSNDAKCNDAAHKPTGSLKTEFQDEWLNTHEAAAYLKLEPKRLLNMASDGQIPHYKFGRRNRYLKSELDRLLRAQPRGAIHGNNVR